VTSYRDSKRITDGPTGGARFKSVTSANPDRNTTEIDMAMRLDPDQDLVTALCEREATAAEALVTAYGDRAYRLAARITGNQQDAEEVVQDAFWSVVRKVDTFRADSAFGSWVYRIVSNAAYGRIRRRPKAFVDIALDEGLPPFHEGGHEGVMSDRSSGIDDPAVQTELRSALSSALAELPAHYRAVMVLHDVEGLTMAEVADALAISVSTAKSRAHRARLSLRKRLSMFMAMAGGSVGDRLRSSTCGSAAWRTRSRSGTTATPQCDVSTGARGGATRCGRACEHDDQHPLAHHTQAGTNCEGGRADAMSFRSRTG
jgi:RNA polymerase sigma-70 factor, ECF subfamily